MSQCLQLLKADMGVREIMLSIVATGSAKKHAFTMIDFIIQGKTCIDKAFDTAFDLNRFMNQTTF